MKDDKLTGRIVHFLLSSGSTMAILSGFRKMNDTILVFVSIVVLCLFNVFGYSWEYYIQQKIADTFPFLKWNKTPDRTAYEMFILGSAIGVGLFWLIN